MASVNLTYSNLGKLKGSLILFFLVACFSDLFSQENYDTLRLLRTFEEIKVMESRNIDSSFLLAKKCFNRGKAWF